MCRVRNAHTSAPWTTAFICLTLDDSCTDSNGKYVDKPLTVRMVQWQPFCVKESFDHKTPVCAACKKTNRTRSFCRERHKHRQLPWCTVYVLLSALDTADPQTVVAGASKPIEESAKEDSNTETNGASETKNTTEAQDGTTPSEANTTESKEGEKTKTAKKSSGEEGDDINDIAESRTFLAKVSCKSTTIHWLELTEAEGTESNPMAVSHPEQGWPMTAPMMPQVPPNYYPHYPQGEVRNPYYVHPGHPGHPNPYAAWPTSYPPQSPHAPPTPASGAPNPPDASPLPQGGVSAGQAAAEALSRKRPAEEGPIHPPAPGHVSVQQGQHGQHQQWMLYQQMYQAIQPPQMAPQAYPQAGRAGLPHDTGNGGNMMPNTETYNGPQASPKGAEESDAKRQRHI